jgi:hypothetical protein
MGAFVYPRRASMAPKLRAFIEVAKAVSALMTQLLRRYEISLPRPKWSIRSGTGGQLNAPGPI